MKLAVNFIDQSAVLPDDNAMKSLWQTRWTFELNFTQINEMKDQKADPENVEYLYPITTERRPGFSEMTLCDPVAAQ